MSVKTPRAHREATDLAAGFTPGAKDVPGLVSELSSADEERGKAIGRALLRVPGPAAAHVLESIPSAVRPQRGRLTAVLGQLHALTSHPAILPTLVTLTQDSDLKTQINAVTALGRIPGGDSEAALLALWAAVPRPELRRALLRSLGKSGGETASTMLSSAAMPDDPEERRLLEQARLILARTTTRGEVGRLRGDVRLRGVEVELACRAGLAKLLVDELKVLFPTAKPRAIAPDRVRMPHDGSLNGLFNARLMDGIALPLSISRDGTTQEAVAKAVDSSVARTLVARLTEGRPRFRIDWRAGTKAKIWSLAKLLTSTLPDWINDPTGSLWDLRVTESAAGRFLSLVPKRLDDPRFAYRAGDVPAASHPTLAAALARLAGVREGDVVWDPFVGSGTELVERAKLGAYRKLMGSDVSADAIETARRNLACAGVGDVDLVCADALSQKGRSPSLILTNPPMGRRVARGELKPLLEKFMTHAAAELAPGGRLVWISPLPARSAERLAELGLKVTFRQVVDMGGFDAELQVAKKPN